PAIVLFARMGMVLRLPTNFLITPGDAVAYAPYMLALGLLARLQPGSWRTFGLTAAAISVLVLYSICCDPPWTMISGMSFMGPFAVVTVSGLDIRTVVLSRAALPCC